MADHRTLSSGPRLVALWRHGAAKADEHVKGHARCTRRPSVLEKRVCLDDTLRSGLRYWRHHRAPVVFWAGWTLFGSRLFAEFLVLFVLAYIFGIAFQYLPIRAMRRISRREALVEAIKADTLALTAFEIGLFAWMAFVYFQFVPRSELTSPTYWFMMQIGMVLGFIASFPANWYLVRAAVKPGM
jgi:Domain of unknown function (DUF4396)